jgi:hypothetical protein
LALGAAFLREARFSFFRSVLSSIFFVFATEKSSFHQSVCEMSREFNGNGIAGLRKGGPGLRERDKRCWPFDQGMSRTGIQRGPVVT